MMHTRRTLPVLTLLAAALLFSAAAHAQRVVRTFPAGEDAVVEILNLHGHVVLHGWNKPQVKVIAIPRTRAVEAHFETSANRIHIHTHLLQSTAPTRDHMVDYEVWAPATARLQLELKTGSMLVENFREDVHIDTVTATVQLRNLAGHTSVNTLNGSIEATHCSGRLEATTISGTLRFRDSFTRYLSARTTSGDIYFVGGLRASGSYEFSSNEGLIELTLPADASFELKADSSKGTVISEFPLKRRSHGRVPQRPLQRSLLGTAQTGGAMVRATSFSGTIRIRKQ